MSGTTERLSKLVANVLAETGTPVDGSTAIDVNKSLVAGYGLTSVALIKLVMAIENDFQIQVDDDDLNTDNFESITTIQELLEAGYSIKA